MYTETRSLEIEVKSPYLLDWLTSAFKELMHNEVDDPIAPLEEALFRIGFGGILSFDCKENASKSTPYGREIIVDQTYYPSSNPNRTVAGNAKFYFYYPEYVDYCVIEYKYLGDVYQIMYNNQHSGEKELYVWDLGKFSRRQLTRTNHNCKYDD